MQNVSEDEILYKSLKKKRKVCLKIKNNKGVKYEKVYQKL